MISINIIIAREDESGQARIIRDQMLCSVVESYRQEMIKIAKSGKPYLEVKVTGFSVSHSNGAVLVAVNSKKAVPDAVIYYEGGNDYNIGCDIEALGKRNSKNLIRLCDKKFSDLEKARVEASEDKKTAILEIWTKKEAYLKLIGTGIKGLMTADTETLSKDYIFYTEKVSLNEDDFILSVCVKR